MLSPLNVIGPDDVSVVRPVRLPVIVLLPVIATPAEPVIKPVTLRVVPTVAAPRIAVVVVALPSCTPLAVTPPILINDALPLSMSKVVAATAGPVIVPPNVALPATESVLDRVVTPLTPRVLCSVVVPETTVLPVSAANVNLVGDPIVTSPRNKLVPVTSSVPVMVVLPLAPVTWNLLGPTVKLPATVALPRIAVGMVPLPRFTTVALVGPMLIAEALPLSITKVVPAFVDPVIFPASFTENCEKPLACRSMRLPA